MSVLTQLLSRNQQRTREGATLLNPGVKSASRCGETAWGALTFLLFLALGPFAAVPALISVFSIASGQEEFLEPDPRRD